MWTAGGPQDHTPRKGTRALPPLPLGQTLRLTLATAALSTAPGLREACVPSAGSPAALGQSPGTVLGSCVRTCPAQSHPAGCTSQHRMGEGPSLPSHPEKRRGVQLLAKQLRSWRSIPRWSEEEPQARCSLDPRAALCGRGEPPGSWRLRSPLRRDGGPAGLLMPLREATVLAWKPRAAPGQGDRVLLHHPQGPAAPGPGEGPSFGGLASGHRVSLRPTLSRLGPTVQEGALHPEPGLWARAASIPASPSPSSRPDPHITFPFPGTEDPSPLSSGAARSLCEQLLGQRNSHFYAIKWNSTCSLKRNAVDQAKSIKHRGEGSPDALGPGEPRPRGCAGQRGTRGLHQKPTTACVHTGCGGKTAASSSRPDPGRSQSCWAGVWMESVRFSWNRGQRC